MSRVRKYSADSVFGVYEEQTMPNNAWEINEEIKKPPTPKQYSPSCPVCRRRENLNQHSNICTHCLLRKKNPFIEKCLRIQLLSKYAYNLIQWSGICAVVFIVLLIDISLRCPSASFSWLHRTEVILCKGSFIGIFLGLGICYLTMHCMDIVGITKEPFIEKCLRIQLLSKYAYNLIQWSGICAVVFIVLLIDISLRCPSASFSWLHRTEVILCKGSFMGIFLCLGIYYLTMHCMDIVGITKEQKQLLGIFNDGDDDDDGDSDLDIMNLTNQHDGFGDNGFVSELKYHFKGNHRYRPCVCVICKAMSSVFTNQQFLELLKVKFKPMSPPAVCDISSNSRRKYHVNSFSPYCTGSSAQYYRPPIISPQDTSLDYLNKSTWSKNSSFTSAYASQHEDLIDNERDLQKYIDKSLRKFDEMDTLNCNYANNNPGNVSNSFVSFWRYFSTPVNNFITPVYQFSPLPVSAPDNEQKSQDIYVRQSPLVKSISPDRLVQYVAKLRRWLSSTILERLCDEIESSNKIFRQCGLSDVEIGNVGLERLRKIVEDRDFVNRYMPDLPTLYRFLNFCSNQFYYVQRIKELANGSCLADYNWNNMNSLKLGRQLPSDAAILFHLFCVYMDSQLMPMPQGGSERPFYSQYVILTDGKHSVNDLIKSVRNRAQCAIICNDLLRPKFSFLCNNEIQSCVSDCNNLFYVIIQFLLYMRNHKDGMLEGVSLGIQGINILCVIED